PPSFIGTGPLLRTRGVDSSSSALTGLSGTEAGAQRWPVREIASAEGPKRDTREPGVSWQSAASNQSPPAHSRPTVRTPATPARDQRNPAAARSLIGASIIGPLDAVLSCLLDDSTNQTLPQDFRELSRLKGEATAAPRWDEQQPRKRRRLLAVRYPHFVSDPRPALQKNDAIERLVADAVEKASAFVPKASSTSASAFPLGDSLKAYGANISGSSSGTDSTSLSGPAATTGIKDLFGGASETASGGTASGKLLFGAASGEAKSLFGATSGTGTESKSGNLFGFGSGSGSLPPVAEVKSLFGAASGDGKSLLGGDSLPGFGAPCDDKAGPSSAEVKSLFGSDSQAGPTKNIFGAASDTSGGESKSLFGESAGEGVKVKSLFGVDSISASTGGEAKSLFGAASGTGTESKSGNLFGFGSGSGSLPPVAEAKKPLWHSISARKVVKVKKPFCLPLLETWYESQERRNLFGFGSGCSGSVPPVFAEAKSLFGSDSQAGPTKNIFGAASDTSGGESKSLFGESAGEGVKVKSLFGVDSISASTGGEAKSLFGAASGTGTESKSGNLFGFGSGSGSLPPVAEAKSLFGSDSQAGPTKNIFGAASDTSGGESKSLFGESAGEGVKVKSLFGVDSISASTGGEAKSLFGAASGTGTESKSGNLFGFGSGSGSLPPVAEAKSLFGSDSQAGPTKNIFGAASDTSGGESKSLFGESAGEGVKVKSLFGVDSISASTGGEAKSLFGAASGTGTESKSGNLFGFGSGSGSLPPVAEAKSLFGSDSQDGPTKNIFARGILTLVVVESKRLFGELQGKDVKGKSLFFGVAKSLFGSDSQAGPTKNIFGAASDTSGGESKSLFGESAGEGVKVKSLFGVDSIGSSAGLFSFGSAASADSAGDRGSDRPAKASRRMGNDESRGGDEGEEAQPSQVSQPRKADPEVLAKRRMVRARRSSTAGDAAYPPPAAAIEVLDDSPVQPDKAAAPSFFAGMAAVASSTAPEPSAPSAAGVPEESSKEPEAETGPIKVETKEDLWRVQIEAIYRRRNHHKLGDVKGMMEKYKGKEVVLFKKVCLRYDLDPKKLYTDPKSWDDEDKDVKDEGEEEKPAGGVAAVADLFGGSSSGSGLFSAAPASSGGLFDNPTASSGSIFGGSGGGGLFAAPASGGSSPPASLFGSSFAAPSAPPASGSLFGGPGSLFGASSGAAPSISAAPSMFSFGADVPGGSSASNSSPAASMFSFGAGAGAPPSGADSGSPVASPAASMFSFGAGAGPTTSASTASPNIFSMGAAAGSTGGAASNASANIFSLGAASGSPGGSAKNSNSSPAANMFSFGADAGGSSSSGNAGSIFGGSSTGNIFGGSGTGWPSCNLLVVLAVEAGAR
ncbi:unnamed protein product, partial [Polarella glacialis]